MAYLAPSLDNLRDEVDALWPNRSKVSDGWIADENHSEDSDHQPNSRGSVNALDITSADIDVDAVVQAAIKHPSTYYVISRGKIYSSTYGFAARDYNGSNPHYSHIHVSIFQTLSAEQNKTSWNVEEETELPLSNEDVQRVANAVWAKQFNVAGYNSPLAAGSIQGITLANVNRNAELINEIPDKTYTKVGSALDWFKVNYFNPIRSAVLKLESPDLNEFAKAVADAVKPLIDSTDNDLTAEDVIEALRVQLNK